MVSLIKQTYKAPNDASEKQHAFGYIVGPWRPWESGARMPADTQIQMLKPLT